MYDPLGDEMKAFEKASAPEAFPRDKPIYARIDGRGFSRFTRDMDRPFDARMTAAMLETAQGLFHETGAKAAYVQSDEISLVWEAQGERGEHFFGGKPFKMCSVLSGMATALFTQALIHPERGLGDYIERLPHFDARVVSMPDRATAAQMVAWRGQDARRNAITMIAQSRYSHKSLQGVSTAQMRERLAADGVRLEDYPNPSLNGSFIYGYKAMLPLDEETRMKIPERNRPSADHLFERRVAGVVNQYHPSQIRNLEAVIFEGASPISETHIKSAEKETT